MGEPQWSTCTLPYYFFTMFPQQTREIQERKNPKEDKYMLNFGLELETQNLGNYRRKQRMKKRGEGRVVIYIYIYIYIWATAEGGCACGQAWRRSFLRRKPPWIW